MSPQTARLWVWFYVLVIVVAFVGAAKAECSTRAPEGAQVMDRNGVWRDCRTGARTNGKARSAVQEELGTWCSAKGRKARREADRRMLRALLADGFNLGEELPLEPTHADIEKIVVGVWGSCE